MITIANKRTISSKKYQDKVGLISKSYKLKKEVVQEFSNACEKAGISQSAQLSKMMSQFAKEIKDGE